MWQQKDFETALRYSYATMLHFLSALSALLEAYSSSPHSVEINYISFLPDFAWIQFSILMNINIFTKQEAGCDTLILFLALCEIQVAEKYLRIHTVILLSIPIFLSLQCHSM